MSSEKYLQRGVSAAKEDVHAAIKNLQHGLFPKAFCKIHPDYLAGDADYVNVMSSDGSGTKSVLAYLYWKETGDASIWRGIAQDVIVMNLDDLLCVGATGPFLFNSIINRNKHRISGEVIKEIIEGTAAFFELMKKHDIHCEFLGGETADLGDITQTLTVDGTMTTRMAKKDVINTNQIKAGQVIVGLASYGKSTYETEENSGIGSNGLTSARHDLLQKKYLEQYPETYDFATNKDVLYCGNYDINEIGKQLLSPTRTFAPIIARMLKEQRENIYAMVHCTGGAQTKVLHYIDNVRVVKNNLLPIPSLFLEIQKMSGTSWEEMFKVYNCGTRFEIYTNEHKAQAMIDIAHSFGVDAQVIGHTEHSEKAEVEVIHPLGTYLYS
jgi:phosphoribosylformylglycinamidine cyclo-ligase